MKIEIDGNDESVKKTKFPSEVRDMNRFTNDMDDPVFYIFCPENGDIYQLTPDDKIINYEWAREKFGITNKRFTLYLYVYNGFPLCCVFGKMHPKFVLLYMTSGDKIEKRYNDGYWCVFDGIIIGQHLYKIKYNKLLSNINNYKKQYIQIGTNILDCWKKSPHKILLYKWTTHRKKKFNIETKKWDFVKTNYIKNNGVTNFIPDGTNAKIKKWSKIDVNCIGPKPLPNYLGIRFKTRSKGKGSMTSELIRVKTNGKNIIKIY